MLYVCIYISIYNFYNELSANYEQDTVYINLLFLIFTITMQSREHLILLLNSFYIDRNRSSKKKKMPMSQS